MTELELYKCIRSKAEGHIEAFHDYERNANKAGIAMLDPSCTFVSVFVLAWSNSPLNDKLLVFHTFVGKMCDKNFYNGFSLIVFGRFCCSKVTTAQAIGIFQRRRKNIWNLMRSVQRGRYRTKINYIEWLFRWPKQNLTNLRFTFQALEETGRKVYFRHDDFVEVVLPDDRIIRLYLVYNWRLKSEFHPVTSREIQVFKFIIHWLNFLRN